jgi:hypothetical protein
MDLSHLPDLLKPSTITIKTTFLSSLLQVIYLPLLPQNIPLQTNIASNLSSQDISQESTLSPI